jgi:hypothetical protein
MTSDRSLRIIYALFLLDIIIISWEEIKLAESPIGWPRPSRYVGVGVAFSMLALFADFVSAELAAVIGAGLTVGLVMNHYLNPNQELGENNLWNDITGSYSTPGSTGLSGSVQV